MTRVGEERDHAIQVASIFGREPGETKRSGSARRGAEHSKIFEMALRISRIDCVGGGLGNNRSEGVWHFKLHRPFITYERVRIATQERLPCAGGAQERALHPTGGLVDISGDHKVDDIRASRESMNWISTRRIDRLESERGDCAPDRSSPRPLRPVHGLESDMASVNFGTPTGTKPAQRPRPHGLHRADRADLLSFADSTTREKTQPDQG
ncbi:hypothetical protein [Microbacterium sp.]|uniref:hypothetical protein n=1 Tax=Microbacterium sp. TaxID=51671 RepID=UPI003A92BF85